MRLGMCLSFLNPYGTLSEQVEVEGGGANAAQGRCTPDLETVVFLSQELSDSSLKLSHINWHFSFLLHKICAKSFCLVKFKFRASDGANVEGSPEHWSFLFEWTTLSSFLECDLKFKIPVESLGTPRDLRKPSMERANILLHLAKEETDACVECRLSWSVEENYWTSAARKHVNVELKNTHWDLKENNNL